MKTRKGIYVKNENSTTEFFPVLPWPLSFPIPNWLLYPYGAMQQGKLRFSLKPLQEKYSCAGSPPWGDMARSVKPTISLIDSCFT